MHAKRMLFRSEARERVLGGAATLADAVRVTIGPRSHSVLMQQPFGPPLVCNDGVTIARELVLEDPVANLGVQIIREAAERTGDAVGDGTSTATVLAHAMFAHGVRNVVSGASAVDLKRGLERAARAAIDALRAQARPVRTRTEKEQVATISAHNDPGIGAIVADAMERVGSDGIITVEESKTTATQVEVVEGMRFDRGWVSPYFVTDRDKMETVLEDARVLLTDRKLTALRDLLPLLERVAGAGAPLLVVADDVDGEALATLVVNRVRGTLGCCAVRAPEYGERRREMLADIAVLTGGRVIDEALGVPLDRVTTEHLGSVRRVVVDREHTTLIGGRGEPGAIAARRHELQRQIEGTTSDYDREKLEGRLARLAGGVAVIRVGAPSEAEMKSRKEALDDAIHATQAAVEEGLVPGGGLALLRCAPAVEAVEAALTGDERTGAQVLRLALEVPARQIAENSDTDAGVVVERMRHETGSVGFDAARREWVDLDQAGIVDPVKVVRVALENAVSVAGVLLLTEATMTERPAPEPEHVPALE